MEIIIGGDIVPTKSNEILFSEGNINDLLGNELYSIINESDLSIFNLEVPLTDFVEPIKKCGPNLIASTKSINALKKLQPVFFTLANNHILDQGAQGLKSTMDLLHDNNIPFAGAGNNIEEASKPFIFEKEGLKIGIYCCAEHEFSIASDKSAGANPFDPLESLDHIKTLKNECDFVIVLYHGGKEHYRYPSPYLQKVCRKIADKGADLIICQHTHCIGCEERWNNSTIVYGQGNFLFDHSDSDFWKTSLLIKLSIDNSNSNIEYIPIEKTENTVRMSCAKNASLIMKDFNERSLQISKGGFIQDKYRELSEESMWAYLFRFSGKMIYLFVALNKISHNFLGKKLFKAIYSEKNILSIVNVIDCEVHREMFLNAYRNYCKKK